jgi:hypothetical protein
MTTAPDNPDTPGPEERTLTTMATIATSAARPYGEVPGRDFLDVDLTAAGRVATVSIRWGSNQGYEQVHGEEEYTRRATTLADAIDAVRDVALAAHTGKDGAETRALIEKACGEALRAATAAETAVSL